MKSQTFLKLDGVEGDSTDVRHRGWFDVVAVFYGGSQINMPRDPSTGQATGKRQYKPFRIVVCVGRNFANIASLGQNSKALRGGEIVFVSNGIPTSRKVLNDVMIQSYSMTKDPHDYARFTATLNVIAGMQDEWLSPSAASSSSIPGRSAMARKS